jgi:hypothetical protein
VYLQHLSPAPVPKPPRLLRGADNVGEQHRGQHPRRLGEAADTGQELLDMAQGELRRLPDQRVLDSRKLDQLRSRDVLGEVASVLDGDQGKSRRCRISVGAWINGRMGRASMS